MTVLTIKIQSWVFRAWPISIHESFPKFQKVIKLYKIKHEILIIRPMKYPFSYLFLYGYTVRINETNKILLEQEHDLFVLLILLMN